MKTFQQNKAGKLEETHLAESDHVCQCCRTYEHSASEYLHDDVVCDTCGELCCCKCHRPDAKR